MKESLLKVIESKHSAVVSNVNAEMIRDVTDFIESYDYDYYVFNSSGDQKNVRLGFINGLNEYTGSEEFINKRVLSELSLINSTYDINIDEHYLQYIVEWVYYIHIMDTPLNYLDYDNNLFTFLIEFFEDRNYIEESIEDQVAIKFLRLARDVFDDDPSLPILQFRETLFTKPTILIVSEDNPMKALYIENLIKDYYDDFANVEESENGLVFIKIHN